ncbi:hypothetical protein LMG27174_01342 [Paraburkholderia rhynchosiae]|uniref:Lipoprotein n=2 Tax=Paraburkholderia rhynchosiae TaxID=487049 RepID=A0A6J5A5M6_9BURK|nr:hypothetical protein LMG27174_01342 [Paraburkholderia rhynchosiae]
MRFILLSAICVVLLTACAGATTLNPLPADRGHNVSAALTGGVSELQIDTASFEISAEAKHELLGAFHAEMTKIGVPVTASGVPVALHVSEFKTRPVAARILFGALSGSDHIKGAVAVAGTEFEVADTGVTVIDGNAALPC